MHLMYFISMALYCCILYFLHYVAVRQRSYDMVSSLIMGGAFVEQVCLTKWTALHEAAEVTGVTFIRTYLFFTS